MILYMEWLVHFRFVRIARLNAPVRPDGDHPRSYGDRTATRKCTRSPAKWTQREKKSPKITNLNKAAFLLRSYCDLCDHTTFSRRAHHDLSAHMAFLVRSMGSATAITGDPAALSPRSWGSYHASSTCIASVRRPPGVSTTFSRRLYIKRIIFFWKFAEDHCAVILHNKHLV